MSYKKLWFSLAAVIIISFAILGYYGGQIYQKMPPIPEKVVTENGEVLFTDTDIKNGQNVWQSIGGQEVGSIWGHGAYVAPDWNADWLHRELVWILDKWGNEEFGKKYNDLNNEQQAQLQARLKEEIRTNTYNADTKELVISKDRAEAFNYLSNYYDGLFTNDPKFDELRENYAIPVNSIKDKERMEDMNAFFFWSTWATATNRPGDEVTYSNNWPNEKLIDNEPIGEMVIWSMFSVVMLLAGVGALAWYFAVQRHKEPHLSEVYPEKDPLMSLKPTPSMKATLKYFWIVAALFLAQIGLGAIVAHYSVEGNGFYGIQLAEILPYSVARTWHTQLGILWIATAWLATGLYMAPAISGYEPKWQRAGINFLFICLLIIVVGSMAGQWLAVDQRFTHLQNFWFGHQGYEYIDLGRFWQIFLAIGLFLWLFLMARSLWPALRKAKEDRHLLIMFFLASTAIPLFYVPGLMWGQHTHLAMAEYWRWWVVHLWVEGFFEVFATVVIAFLFTRMGLLRTRTATASVIFSTTIFLFGGILGTFHHLYFSGTPIGVLAFGATFSALEIVPLVLIGFEAYENLSLSRAKPWIQAYKWPIYCFVAVAFWNLVGAGLFGFLINPPIALYYMQGLNTTPVHGHTALFGVYGMLGIGLMLFCLKGLSGAKKWKTKALSLSFWSINIGLALMVLISVLPIGILQTLASLEHGMWYARSAEFLQQDKIQTFQWMRAIGDTVFAIGVLALGWFILGLKTGWSYHEDNEVVD
ncbi:MAG: nitric-oxide reductase subunit [Bacillales bacterium]|jgi:nitric oxide reductase subunit B|nr:nitric-oxide reductase subunit [Bacillales bacterium]